MDGVVGREFFTTKVVLIEDFDIVELIDDFVPVLFSSFDTLVDINSDVTDETLRGEVIAQAGRHCWHAMPSSASSGNAARSTSAQ